MNHHDLEQSKIKQIFRNFHCIVASKFFYWKLDNDSTYLFEDSFTYKNPLHVSKNDVKTDSESLTKAHLQFNNKVFKAKYTFLEI